MKALIHAVLATAVLTGCSSTPEATEAESTATAVATATADIEPAPTAVASAETTAAPTVTASTPPAPEPAADIAVLAMKITMDPKTAMEIKADKGLYTKGKKVAAFEKNALQLADSKDNIAVMKDGAVVMTPASPVKAHFNDKDELEVDGGGKIAIDDKGKVTMLMIGGKELPKGVAPSVTGFKPEGRRAATLALLMGMMSVSAEPKAAPPATSSGAAPKGTGTAAPAKTSAPPAKSSAPPAMTGAAPKK